LLRQLLGDPPASCEEFGLLNSVSSQMQLRGSDAVEDGITSLSIPRWNR